MSCDISVQPKDSKSVRSRVEVESFIGTLSGVRRESAGVFAYGDKRRRAFVHIYTGDAKTLGSVGVSVPAAYSKASGELALALCFRIADHLGWQVFDEQVGDFLDRSTAAEVLWSQRDYGDTEDEVLNRRSKGEASFGELYAQQFSCHSGWVVIPALALAALAAGYLVVARGMSQDRFVWLFFGAALGLHAARALIAAVWRRFRDGTTAR